VTYSQCLDIPRYYSDLDFDLFSVLDGHLNVNLQARVTAGVVEANTIFLFIFSETPTPRWLWWAGLDPLFSSTTTHLHCKKYFPRKTILINIVNGNQQVLTPMAFAFECITVPGIYEGFRAF